MLSWRHVLDHIRLVALPLTGSVSMAIFLAEILTLPLTSFSVGIDWQLGSLTAASPSMSCCSEQ